MINDHTCVIGITSLMGGFFFQAFEGGQGGGGYHPNDIICLKKNSMTKLT